MLHALTMVQIATHWKWPSHKVYTMRGYDPHGQLWNLSIHWWQTLSDRLMIRTSCRTMPGHAIDYEPTLFPPIPGCPSYIRQYFILRQKGSVTNLICNGLWLLYILLAEATFNHSDLREKRIKANDLSYNVICTCKLVYTRSAMGGDCTQLHGSFSH